MQAAGGTRKSGSTPARSTCSKSEGPAYVQCPGNRFAVNAGWTVCIIRISASYTERIGEFMVEAGCAQ
eukprot:scaffold149926_cov37-Prasinocladus_malaysianus.AAC.1